MTYEIERKGDSQCSECVARNGRLTIRVEPTRAKRCRMFRRHRIHLNSGGRRTQILVAEIDGVFLYVSGDEITMTKKVDIK